VTAEFVLPAVCAADLERTIHAADEAPALIRPARPDDLDRMLSPDWRSILVAVRLS
jgi:hypothetical protein